jgi:hypothetical protein
MLDGGNRLRHGRLRHAKMYACLGHAAVLDDGKQDVQVAQPDPAADPAIPIEDFAL